MISSFSRKWLGLPRCLCNIEFCGKGILKLPISSLSEDSPPEVELEMTLTELCDLCGTQNAPTLATGRKWTPSAPTQQAKSALEHRDIVGHCWCNKVEEASALERTYHLGTRQLCLSDEVSWLRRQRLFLKQSKGSR
ncbi:hypothetical protein LDENG_00286310 [Lucifuga dentata]|nr:hypothetical protein LDENG_00286310 [Lucifuga dentata]